MAALLMMAAGSGHHGPGVDQSLGGASGLKAIAAAVASEGYATMAANQSGGWEPRGRRRLLPVPRASSR